MTAPTSDPVDVFWALRDEAAALRTEARRLHTVAVATVSYQFGVQGDRMWAAAVDLDLAADRLLRTLPDHVRVHVAFGGR